MLLYEDVISGDEMFSDAFPMYAPILALAYHHILTTQKTRKEVDGIAFEVDCQMITLKEGNVDIGMHPIERKKNMAHLLDFVGANASAEEQEEALEDGAITVNNIAHSFRLQATAYDKKAYLSHLKV